MKQHQEKLMFSAKKNNIFHPKPINFVNSYSHSSENKHFPKVTSRRSADIDGNNNSPRILVWGDSVEGPGKKLLAVGDHVLANVLRDCGE